MNVFARKTTHNVEPPRVAAAGEMEITEYQGIDLATKAGTYSLTSPRIGTELTLSRAPRSNYDTPYGRALTIQPAHLDAVIALLTVARDKCLGAR
mgnify:CR=1 FL=1